MINKAKAVAVLCALSLLFVALSSVPKAFARDIYDASTAPEWSYAKEILKVGFFALEGYHDKDSEGNMSGYGYDAMNMIGNYLDKRLVFSGYNLPFRENLRMVVNGELDVLSFVNYTPDRAEYLLYSDEAIAVCDSIVTVRNDNTEIIPEDYSTYDGKVVGMMRGSAQNRLFASFAREKGFKYYESYYESMNDASDALMEGKVDMVIGESCRLMKEETVIDNFGTESLYIVTSKNNTALMAEINRAMKLLQSETPGWKSTLSNRHFKYYDESMFIPDTELEYLGKLKESGTVLSVLACPDRFPYSYVEDGAMRGVMPDIFDAVAKRMGFEYEFVVTADRAQYLEYLNSGKSDLILDYTGDFGNAVEMGYKSTTSYLQTSSTEVRRKGYVGEIKSLALVRDNNYTNGNLLNYYLEKDITYYDSLRDCLLAVVEEKNDATVLFSATTERLMLEDDGFDYDFSILTDQSVSFSIAVNAHRGYLLRSIIEKGLEGLKRDGTVVSILEERTQHVDVKHSLLYLMKANPTAMFVAIVFILMFSMIILVLSLALVRRKNKSLRNELRLQENLEEALEKEAEASLAKTEFLFNMSHDIRTPMNAIIGFTNLLEKHLDDSEKTKDYIAKIKSSSKFLLDLINNVLEMSRIESGKTTLDETPGDIVEFSEEILSVFTPEIEKKNLNFNAEYNVEHTLVFGDQTKIREVILNILSNAIKYTPEGGTINFRCEELPDEDSSYCTIRTTVEDNGIGISKDFLPHLFEEFTREKTSTESKVVGTGLGMPITKKLIEIMGGSIEVESESGVGSKFTVYIRHRIATEEDIHSFISIDSMSADYADRFGIRRILLAEDNDLNAEIASEILSEVGFSVERAANGAECVSMLDASEPDYYDIILMDIQMPVMNGYVATKEIRSFEDSAKAAIPIIAMTANAFEEDRRDAIRAGMNGHISKPIDVVKMMEAIYKAVGGKEDVK